MKGWNTIHAQTFIAIMNGVQHKVVTTHEQQVEKLLQLPRLSPARF
jgi:hypothetical protein